MDWVYSPYAGILHLTSLICINVALLAARRRSTARVETPVLLMLSLGVWAFAAGMEAAVTRLDVRVICLQLEYIGIASAPTLYLIFSIEYSRREAWLSGYRAFLPWIVPLAALLAVFTNSWHHFMWTDITPDSGAAGGAIHAYGIGQTLLHVYNTLVLFGGIFLLALTWHRSPPPGRRQAGALLLGSLFPVAGALLHAFAGERRGPDLVVLSFALAGAIIAVGILRFQLFSLTPAAREALFDSLGEGIIILDAQNHIVELNANAARLLGVSSKNTLGLPVDAGVQLPQHLARQLLDPAHTTAKLDFGTSPPRSVEMNATILRDQGGRAAGRLIVLRNVTEYRQTQIALARNVEELSIINQISLAVTAGLDMERALQTLLEQCRLVAPFDIFYVALYDEANSLVQVPLFYERGRYRNGLSWDIKEHPGFIGKVIAECRTIYNPDRAGHDIDPGEGPKMQPDPIARASIGIPLSLRERVIGVMSLQDYSSCAYTTDQVRILERIAIQAAIAVQNARLYAEVQRLAIIDELTGIYNYRGLLELGTRDVERASRFAHPLSLLFFDIDNFRSFNNTYSHAVGNIILKSVVERCKSVLRTVDILARYGGDEFVVLLPETDIAEAEKVANRMVAEVAAYKTATAYGDLSVTISIGVTSLNRECATLLALIDRANQAEHRAKQGQKGIVAVAP